MDIGCILHASSIRRELPTDAVLAFPKSLKGIGNQDCRGTVGRLRLADVERSELLGSVKNRHG